VQKIAAAHQTDFQIGQLARIRGNSARVRQFGQDLMNYHRTALDRLDESGNLSYPVEIAPEDRLLEQELSSLEGRAFDRKFADAMVEHHEELAGLVQGEAGGASAATRSERPAGTAGTAGTSTDAARSTGERMGAVGTSGAQGGSRASSASDAREVQQLLAQAKRLQRSLGGGSTR
jgi:uncharacterized protein (DUF305 family)